MRRDKPSQMRRQARTGIRRTGPLPWLRRWLAMLLLGLAIALQPASAGLPESPGDPQTRLSHLTADAVALRPEPTDLKPRLPTPAVLPGRPHPRAPAGRLRRLGRRFPGSPAPCRRPVACRIRAPPAVPN